MEVAAKFGENGIHQGVFKGYACYWKMRGSEDYVVSFNIIAGSIMVVAAPPPADGCSRRLASSLGSTPDGLVVRMCCLEVPGKKYDFGFIGVEGVLSVWVKQPEEEEEEKLQVEAGGGAGGEGWKWKRVKEEAAELLWTFRSFRALDEPLDFAGASPRWVLVRKGKTLVLRDLDNVEGEDSTHQE
jgi:hypothetical protein